MGFDFLCESCGKRLTVPPGLYEKKVRGRVVTIACKTCGAPIRIDATVPPPAVEEKPKIVTSSSSLSEPSTQASSDRPAADAPAIPKAARLPEANIPEPFGSFRPPQLSTAPPSSGES